LHLLKHPSNFFRFRFALHYVIIISHHILFLYVNTSFLLRKIIVQDMENREYDAK